MVDVDEILARIIRPIVIRIKERFAGIKDLNVLVRSWRAPGNPHNLVSLPNRPDHPLHEQGSHTLEFHLLLPTVKRPEMAKKEGSDGYDHHDENER